MTLAQRSRSIPCPYCNAQPKFSCRAFRGYYRTVQVYDERVAAFKAQQQVSEALQEERLELWPTGG